jgi:HEAT repeat protein
MDFVALMKYPGPGPPLGDALDRLEAESPEELKDLRRVMEARGSSRRDQSGATWGRWTSDREVLGQPGLPDTWAELHTPEDFYLSFGADTVRVYHLLRWHSFLTEPPLQAAMLEACAALGRLFGATDCVLTSDFSPLDAAFHEGAGFEEALRRGEPGHGEVPNLEDLYLSYTDTWDSFGYWRFRWSPEIGRGWPWPPRPLRVVPSAEPLPAVREPDADTLSGLLHNLRYETRRRQEKAADSLREHGRAARAAVPDLIEALSRRYPSVRARVAQALGEVGEGEAVVAALRRVMDTDDALEVRQAAAAALLRLGAGVDVLRSPDDRRRRQAAEGLGAIGPAVWRAVPALLTTLLAVPPPPLETRRAIARSLWLIGPAERSIPALLEALRDPDDLVRLWIARAFATLGPAAPPAAEELRRALDDPSAMVRGSLAWALGCIESLG